MSNDWIRSVHTFFILWNVMSTSKCVWCVSSWDILIPFKIKVARGSTYHPVQKCIVLSELVDSLSSLEESSYIWWIAIRGSFVILIVIIALLISRSSSFDKTLLGIRRQGWITTSWGWEYYHDCVMVRTRTYFTRTSIHTIRWCLWS